MADVGKQHRRRCHALEFPSFSSSSEEEDEWEQHQEAIERLKPNSYPLALSSLSSSFSIEGDHRDGGSPSPVPPPPPLRREKEPEGKKKWRRRCVLGSSSSSSSGGDENAGESSSPPVSDSHLLDDEEDFAPKAVETAATSSPPLRLSRRPPESKKHPEPAAATTCTTLRPPLQPRWWGENDLVDSSSSSDDSSLEDLGRRLKTFRLQSIKKTDRQEEIKQSDNATRTLAAPSRHSSPSGAASSSEEDGSSLDDSYTGSNRRRREKGGGGDSARGGPARSHPHARARIYSSSSSFLASSSSSGSEGSSSFHSSSFLTTANSSEEEVGLWRHEEGEGQRQSQGNKEGSGGGHASRQASSRSRNRSSNEGEVRATTDAARAEIDSNDDDAHGLVPPGSAWRDSSQDDHLAGLASPHFYLSSPGKTWPKLRVPKVVFKTLYAHQKTGVEWMAARHADGIGGILGDDMGMGKTYTTLTFLFSLMRAGTIRNALIAVPLSVLRSWEREASRLIRACIPRCRITILTSQEVCREKILAQAMNCSASSPRLIITTYGLVKTSPRAFMADESDAGGQEGPFWDYFVLDEAHTVKNHDTQIARACRSVGRNPKTRRLMLTGTPLMNNLQVRAKQDSTRR